MLGTTDRQGGHVARARDTAVTGGLFAGPSLDAIIAALSLLMMLGVALDFRVHAAGISFEEEGFFTPEHVFFYSMFIAIAVVLATAIYHGWRRSGSFAGAVPPGYLAAIGGIALFALGGVGDFVWHTLFGFETGVEALTSPSHLALAVGAGLIFASPLRAMMRRRFGTDAAWGFTPAAVSTGLVMTLVLFFTAYINPVMDPLVHVAGEPARTLGVVGLFAFPTVLLGGALVLARLTPPMGACTVALALPGLMSVVVNDHVQLALPAILAGLTADFLIHRFPPTHHVLALRGFGAAIPVTFTLSYLAIVQLTWGIAWTIHIWAGAIVLAGLAGLLLTYVVVPDAAADRESIGD